MEFPEAAARSSVGKTTGACGGRITAGGNKSIYFRRKWMRGRRGKTQRPANFSGPRQMTENPSTPRLNSRHILQIGNINMINI
ncbi:MULTISPECIES: hypothetical protein [unclassified Rhizobium]|uniref:hypothetical protein n=1 Tax=unclassified Rhizobium TaxID=2613769 RepID=UPI00117B484E|nr:MULTISPECIES: hypothetical protein [unclassified Rhizobium]